MVWGLGGLRTVSRFIMLVHILYWASYEEHIAPRERKSARLAKSYRQYHASLQLEVLPCPRSVGKCHTCWEKTVRKTCLSRDGFLSRLEHKYQMQTQTWNSCKTPETRVCRGAPPGLSHGELMEQVWVFGWCLRSFAFNKHLRKHINSGKSGECWSGQPCPRHLVIAPIMWAYK